MTPQAPPPEPRYRVTEEELIDARKRQETMEPIIPDIFARAIVSDGIRADVLIGDDDDAADASP